MLNQQTLEKLHALHLNGMAEAYSRQMEDASAASLSFEERFGLLVDHHWSWRENQTMARRVEEVQAGRRTVRGGRLVLPRQDQRLMPTHGYDALEPLLPRQPE